MSSHRLIWIDIAKGVGIILVVIGHTGRGLTGASIADKNNILINLDFFIYTFHMPLFFIISGVTIGMRPLDSILPDITRRFWKIFYPLVLWTYLFLAMQAVAGVHANTNASWGDFLTLPLPPVAHFWFLWALLLNVVSFAIVRLLFRPIISDVWFWAIAICISVAANGVLLLPSTMVPWFGAAIGYSVAFALGGLIGASQIREVVPTWQSAITAASLFAFGLWGGAHLKTASWEIAIGSMLSLLLLLPLTWVAANFGQSSAARILAFLGNISLAIYVMHTAFSAAIRIVLIAFAIDNLAIHLVFGIFVGILGPLISYAAARRLRVLNAVGLA